MRGAGAGRREQAAGRESHARRPAWEPVGRSAARGCGQSAGRSAQGRRTSKTGRWPRRAGLLTGTYSYSVARFVPDPIRNEAVNIGVVAVDPETGRVAHKFLRSLRALGPRCPGADLETLEGMVRSLRFADMPGGAADLEDVARRHTNLLQFTPPRAVAAPSLEESLLLAFKRLVGGGDAQDVEGGGADGPPGGGTPSTEPRQPGRRRRGRPDPQGIPHEGRGHAGPHSPPGGRGREGGGGEGAPEKSGGRGAAGPSERGLVIVYTGGGKGKTTAALGLALRASGYGRRICMIQFIKGSWHYGEMDSAQMLGPRFELVPAGRGFVGIIDDTSPRTEHEAAARAALAEAKRRIDSDAYDLVILDEVNYAVGLGLVGIGDVLDAVRGRPARLDIVLTGNGAREELVDEADLVTEMREVKHPYKSGIKAKRGIDF